MSMTRLQEAPAARVEKPTRVPAALRDSGIRDGDIRTPGVRPEQLFRLQRQAGNAAVAQLLRPDTAEEEVQEVEAPDTELAPDREPEDGDEGQAAKRRVQSLHWGLFPRESFTITGANRVAICFGPWNAPS